jgi:integrase
MSIKQRKDSGSWLVHVVAVQPDGTKVEIRKTLPGVNKREAQQFHDNLRASIVAGAYKKQVEAAPEVPTFEAFAKDFLDGYATANNKPSAVAAKEGILRNHLIPAFGKMQLDRIGPKDIEAFKGRGLKAGTKGKTLNNQLSVLRKMLSVAVEWRLIERVPLVRRAKAVKPTVDFLTFAEADQLVAASDDQWRPIITVALRTGLRIGELMALSWSDVDLQSRQLTVRHSNWKGQVTSPKSGRTRVIDLGEGAVAAFQAQPRVLKSSLVFGRSDGKPYTYDACVAGLDRAWKKAGLRSVRWHKLRHTFASHLVMRGADLKVVQECLGHSTMEMTMQYAHLSPKAKKHAVALLDQPAPEWAREQSHSTPTALGGGS